jgi:hypothetical protein
MHSRETVRHKFFRKAPTSPPLLILSQDLSPATRPHAGTQRGMSWGHAPAGKPSPLSASCRTRDSSNALTYSRSLTTGARVAWDQTIVQGPFSRQQQQQPQSAERRQQHLQQHHPVPQPPWIHREHNPRFLPNPPQSTVSSVVFGQDQEPSGQVSCRRAFNPPRSTVGSIVFGHHVEHHDPVPPPRTVLEHERFRLSSPTNWFLTLGSSRGERCDGLDHDGSPHHFAWPQHLWSHGVHFEGNSNPEQRLRTSISRQSYSPQALKARGGFDVAAGGRLSASCNPNSLVAIRV